MIRMYSLCGSQGASGLRIAVKRERDGAGSIYMHDQVHDGDILDFSAPRGNFTLSKGTAPVVLLSAGVGITPLLIFTLLMRMILFVDKDDMMAV